MSVVDRFIVSFNPYIQELSTIEVTSLGAKGLISIDACLASISGSRFFNPHETYRRQAVPDYLLHAVRVLFI